MTIKAFWQLWQISELWRLGNYGRYQNYGVLENYGSYGVLAVMADVGIMASENYGSYGVLAIMADMASWQLWQMSEFWRPENYGRYQNYGVLEIMASDLFSRSIPGLPS